jgi:uncharacterized protein (DUF58 family)
MEFPNEQTKPKGKPRVMGGLPDMQKVVGQSLTEEEMAAQAAAEMPVVTGTPLDPSKPQPEGSTAFEHMCCQAVRPNPEDPDPTGAVQDVQVEPYLTWRSSLKPTSRFGAMLVFAGLVGIGAATLGFFLQIVLALVGMAIALLMLLFLVTTFVMAASASKNVRIQAVRHVMDPELERGKLFHVSLDTTGSILPAGGKVTITDQHAPGLRPVEKPSVDGIGRIHYRVRPQGRGLLTFSGLDVVVEGGLGFWVEEQEWRLRTTVEVEPSVPAHAWRARVTGAVAFDNSIPQTLVKLYRDVEYEEIREFAPGDRMKDIDWKRMAISGKMTIRKRTSEPETTILTVIDAGNTMMLDQAGFRNLDFAIDIAQEFVDAGLKRNHEVGILAFNEERILDHVRPTRSKIQMKKVAAHLQKLADHHLPGEGDDAVEVLIAGDPENLRLGMQQGIKQRGTANLTIVVFSDLQTMPDEIVQTLSKAASSGQHVVIMLLPGPKLRPVGKHTAEDAAIESRGIEHTNRMREILIVNGCEFLEINPGEEDFSLELPLPAEA